MAEESIHSPEGDTKAAQSLSYRGKQGEDQALSYRGRQGEVTGPLPKGLAGRSPSRTLPDEKHNVAEEQEVPGAHLRPTYSGTVNQIMMTSSAVFQGSPSTEPPYSSKISGLSSPLRTMYFTLKPPWLMILATVPE